MRKLELLSVLVFLCTASALAAPTTQPFASPNLRPDIEYGTADGVSLKLDAYVPPGDGPFPVAILVHGGGWSSGDRKSEFAVLFQPLADAHYDWFSIEYRMAPKYKWPACYEDVRTAIAWVKAHAAEYKGDPRHIALIGYSAGAQLSFLAAVQADDATRVAAVVGFAPPTDMEADTKRRGGLSTSLKKLFGTTEIDDRVHGLLHDMTPNNFITANLPPFLILQGNADKSVMYPASVRFQTALKSAGVPCDFITIERGPHDVTKWKSLRPMYQAEVIDWLNKTLK